jgi:hypothetical protein
MEVQEAGLLVPSPPAPGIVTKADRQPIKPLEADLQYVVDYLRQEAGARAVIATSSLYGWENVSIPCICLYVDADSTERLAESTVSQQLPTIITTGRLIDATANIDAATQLIAPPGLDKVAVSAREFELKKNRIERMIQSIGSFVHGQSISLMAAETKGSVAVFLSPDDDSEDQSYALTAYHVVPFIPSDKRQIITPGGLDILTRLLQVLRIGPRTTDYDEIDFLLHRWGNKCGEVQYGHIGTNGNGWRSDWALVCLENEWKGVNGSWMYNEMTEFHTAKSGTLFTGLNGIIDCIDPLAGDICYKDGASTGCTAGSVGPTDTLVFKKGSADVAEEGSSEGDIDRNKMFTVHPLGGEEYVALSGDSGCGVFCPVPERDGWNWVGQVVSVFHEDNAKKIALMVPQSEILHSLKEVTGKSWKLTYS